VRLELSPAVPKQLDLKHVSASLDFTWKYTIRQNGLQVGADDVLPYLATGSKSVSHTLTCVCQNLNASQGHMCGRCGGPLAVWGL
jgi:hypothetical protein